MLEVRLHGALAKEFGKVWHLDVKTPAEAVYAISAMKPRFRQAIIELDRMGLVFRVRTKSHDFTERDLTLQIPGQRLDIIPIVRGASAGLRFVAGAILVVIGVVIDWYTGGTGGNYFIAAGIGLMVGSVVQWLTPVPKPAKAGNALQSWTINGPTNTVDQGNPVPVCYGEVLVGGYTVSAGVSASSLDTSSSTAGGAVIGGTSEDVKTYRSPPGSSASVQFLLTAGSHAGMGSIYSPSYHWSVTGFDGATVTTAHEGTSLRVTVTAPPSNEPIVEFSGSVTLGVSGMNSLTKEDVDYSTTTPLMARFGQGS
jgi:predicted phage tail protein